MQMEDGWMDGWMEIHELTLTRLVEEKSLGYN